MTHESEDLSQQKIKLPDFPKDDSNGYDLEKIMSELNKSGQIADYNDIASLHTQVNAARLSLYRIVVAQSQADKDAIIAEQKYKRIWNRVYQSASGTEKIKATTADIKSENYQNDYVVSQMRCRELARRAQFIRDDLKALESLSNDYRQIIRSQQ